MMQRAQVKPYGKMWAVYVDNVWVACDIDRQTCKELADELNDDDENCEFWLNLLE